MKLIPFHCSVVSHWDFNSGFFVKGDTTHVTFTGLRAVDGTRETPEDLEMINSPGSRGRGSRYFKRFRLKRNPGDLSLSVLVEIHKSFGGGKESDKFLL